MAEDSGVERREAITWSVGALVAAALITYAAWHNARDNARLAQEAHSGQQAPARAPAH